jgi:hypothetical protein
MSFFDFSFWQDFVSNLLATTIGVALGIPVAFWINKRVGDITEKEKRQKILHILWTELLFIEEGFYFWKIEGEKGGEDIIALVASLSDESWRALADGGELQWLKDSELLRDLSQTYAQIKIVRYISDKYYEAIIRRENISEEAISYLSEQLNKNMDKAQRLINGVTDTIQVIAHKEWVKPTKSF